MLSRAWRADQGQGSATATPQRRGCAATCAAAPPGPEPNARKAREALDKLTIVQPDYSVATPLVARLPALRTWS